MEFNLDNEYEKYIKFFEETGMKIDNKTAFVAGVYAFADSVVNFPYEIGDTDFIDYMDNLKTAINDFAEKRKSENV